MSGLSCAKGKETQGAVESALFHICGLKKKAQCHCLLYCYGKSKGEALVYLNQWAFCSLRGILLFKR